jgi:hypothetical protein
MTFTISTAGERNYCVIDLFADSGAVDTTSFLQFF